ncbi:hypothetical protein [Argonema galeatum]|uniref:hypothetical protein n=1 Tax=Argonema galeatum TaxID=2942762 RepID=UPI002011F00A|nr:hypothetical protein [Argonema galeatum]MCL1467327.1 hypothetical protein [Argonema galeatum A003/A1]
MSRRLIQKTPRSRLPLHHPNRLPTFEPIVLGSTILLVGLGLMENWSFIWLLAPVLLTFSIMVPIPRLRVAILVGLLGLAIALLHGDGLLIRQSLELSSIPVFASLIRRFLQDIEWRLASQSVLATLAQADSIGKYGSNDTANIIISQVLSLLRDFAGADAAIAVRQLDEVTAEVLMSLPARTLPSSLTAPTLFAEALAQNRCLYYIDYPLHKTYLNLPKQL